VDKRDTVETQKSSVPLKWACTDAAPVTSAYTAAFRNPPPGGPQVTPGLHSTYGSLHIERGHHWACRTGHQGRG
jgi:hypothetical protein